MVSNMKTKFQYSPKVIKELLLAREVPLRPVPLLTRAAPSTAAPPVFKHSFIPEDYLGHVTGAVRDAGYCHVKALYFRLPVVNGVNVM